MPRTRKTTPVSSRTRKQTSARTLRNRGGNPATKKLIISLAGIIAAAIFSQKDEIMSLFMGERAEKAKLSLLYRFPFILVWGVDNTMLDDLKTEFPKFIMNAEIQDLREKKTQYEKQKLYKKQKQYKTTQQCRVESDIVRLYKKNTPCVCFIDGSLKEFEFPNDDNIFVIWGERGVSEPS